MYACYLFVLVWIRDLFWKFKLHEIKRCFNWDFMNLSCWIKPPRNSKIRWCMLKCWLLKFSDCWNLWPLRTVLIFINYIQLIWSWNLEVMCRIGQGTCRKNFRIFRNHLLLVLVLTASNLRWKPKQKKVRFCAL